MEKEKLVQTVQQAQAGNSDALNALFNAFYNDVYYFALKTVKDEDLACDITQETFVEIINTLGNLKEPAAFVTWMKQITYHQCTRYFKKKKDVLVEENEDGDTVFDTMAEERTEFIPDEAVDQEDFRATIMGMIDQLSEEQRAATMMYYFDEMSVKEIAQAQGVGENTVKGRLSYARKSIKKSVEDYEKKNNVKLHSVALLPLLLWLFRNQKKAMPVATAKKVAAGASAATGVSLSAAAGKGTVTAGSVAAAGIWGKLAAMPTALRGAAIAVAVAAAVGAVAIGVVVAQGNGNTNTTQTTTVHTHSYTAVTQEATCTEKGKVVHTCACGDSYTEEVDATGHSYVANTTPATCTEDGKTDYICACGDSYTETIVAKGHAYATTTKEATCTQDGETTYTCTCGDSYSEVIVSEGHTYSEATIPGTCTQDGKIVYTCNCGDTYETSTGKSHDWGQWEESIPANTFRGGEQMRTCAECGAEESKTTSKVSAESNLIMFANDVAKLLDCTTGEFASIDEISTYNIKQAALVGVHWERKSDPNWDTMEFTYKVSDLNNFMKRYFGRSCDWTNTEDTWPGAVYDPATNTLKVNFLAAGGGGEKDFQTVRDHGDGTYTVAEENDSWSLELVVKKTGNGYTLISYQRH